MTAPSVYKSINPIQAQATSKQDQPFIGFASKPAEMMYNSVRDRIWEFASFMYNYYIPVFFRLVVDIVFYDVSFN